MRRSACLWLVVFISTAGASSGIATPPARAETVGVSVGVRSGNLGLSEAKESRGHLGQHGHRRHGDHHHRKFVAAYDPRRTHAHPELPLYRPYKAPSFRVRYEKRDPLLAHTYFSSWVAECEARYPTFDPHSGTYLAQDGSRRL